MGGLRPEPVAARRLLDTARAGGARGASGYLPAATREHMQTVHTPGRVRSPDPVKAEPGGGGVYVPAFSIAGPVEAKEYRTVLHNVTGSAQTITGVAVSLGREAFGAATTVRLRHATTGQTIATVDMFDGDEFVQVLGLSYTWQPGAGLVVVVLNVASPEDPGEDLVLQVITG